MNENRWKPAFIALSIVLIAWCFFLILHNQSLLGGFALLLLGMSMLLVGKQSSESAAPMKLSLAKSPSVDHSHAELHELQDLCTLEIDLEKDISRLSKRYSDVQF